MLKWFYPKLYISSYQLLNPDYLKQHHIKLLVCDIDNTLVPHDVANPDEAVFAFVEKMKEHGILMALVSNNVEERVKVFAKPLGIPYYPFAKKPFQKQYHQILKDFKLSRDEVAVLGDQLLTDMLGGNLAHFYTILSKPVVTRDLKWTKINRLFENLIYRLLEHKKLLIRGEFDDETL